MMESINKTLIGAKNGWTKIDTKKRTMMIVLIISILSIFAILTYSKGKADYVTLFSNLELKDAGVIAKDLEGKKIKYKLVNGGRDILVDKGVVDGYRIQLAMDGMLPESSTGFEIFDDTGMMVTDQDRAIMYQRALTGELQRSIMSLEAINSAKVLLVMPEKSIFETEEKPASASVVIEIKPSQRVNNDMIRGIAALISGAVNNMPLENIQVIDTNGTLLSGFLNQESSASALDVVSQYQEVRIGFENELQSNLSSLLGSAFGKEKIKVSVRADLDFDSEESTLISYSNPVARSEQINASGGNIDIQQANGGSIDDNISNVTDSVAGDRSTYSKTINNELSTETKTTIKAPGKVNKLTTSIIYDGKLSDENLLKIESIAAAATGYDEARGDVISVEGIQFDREAEEKLQAELDEIRLKEEEGTGILGKYSEYITLGLRVFGGIFLISLVIMVARNMKRKSNEDRRFQEQLSVGTNVDRALEAVAEELEVEPDTKGIKAQKYAKDNPALAADLIKAWMKD